MLNCEINTKEMQAEVDAFLDGSDEIRLHDCVQSFYEHGQWFASCSECGASWSINDSEPDMFCLDQIDNGDESCFT